MVEPLSEYCGEVASALLTSCCVAPMVALIDKAIFMNASGQTNYRGSFHHSFKKFLVKPTSYFARKSFWWSYVVYTATFVTFNCSERALQHVQAEHQMRMRLLAVCCVNVPLSTLRDRYLVRTYSPQPERRVGRRTTIAFALRDVINMIGAFSAIGPVSEYLESRGLGHWYAQMLSQIICPFCAMLINTPVFMFALQVHNFPNAGAKRMIAYIWNNFWDTFYWARMARVGTAYSVGGVLNMGFRRVLTSPAPPPPAPPRHTR